MNKPASSTLQLLWPKDNWASLINDERPDELIQILTLAYESIRINPRTKHATISDAQWQDSYATSIAVLKALFRKTKTIEQALQLNQRFCERFGLDYESIDTMPIQKSYIYWTVSNKELSMSGKDAIIVDFAPSFIPIAAEANDSKVEEPKLLPQPKVEQQRFGPAFYNSKIDLNQFQEEFFFKKIIVSKDHDANDIPQRMHECYEAMCDLADALEIPRKWIGMNTLTLLIGHEVNPSKGDKLDSIKYSGKESGAPIAHQWFNCFDARIANSIRTNMKSFDTYVSTMYQEDLIGKHTQKTRAIFQIIKKITAPMNVYSPTRYDYLSQSLNHEMNNGLAKGSYTGLPEMIARAFTAFIEDRLTLLTRSNYYLTKDTQKHPEGIYPQSSERKAINNLFQALFIAIKNPEPAPDLTENKNP